MNHGASPTRHAQEGAAALVANNSGFEASPPAVKLKCQPHLYPANLFDLTEEGQVTFWTCIRTRARWEKKLALWLADRRIPHYLPTYFKQTTQHRKTRSHHMPLFIGYVFVQGNMDKHDFIESNSAAGVLKPTTQLQIERLHSQLWNLWRGLVTGSALEVAKKLVPGQRVRVVAGPMKGVEGRFEKWGKNGRLILALDMLNIGVALEVPDSCTIIPLDG